MAKEHVIGPYSAYAIAVKHGFVGTEAEWAALQKSAPEYARQAAQSASGAAGSAAQASANAQTATNAATAAQASAEASGAAAQAAQLSADAASGAQTAADNAAQSASKSALEAQSAADHADAVAGSIPEEYTELAEKVRRKAPAIILTESGRAVVIQDAAQERALNVVTTIEPGQQGYGDPSIDNVRPINGWNVVTLHRTGRNLFGGIALAQKIVETVDSAVMDETAKTIYYGANKIADKTIFEYPFKANTAYTFIFKLSADSASTTPNMSVVYTDGTVMKLNPIIGDPLVYTTDSQKTVARLIGRNYSATTTLMYEECGVFEGVVSADDFAPYIIHTLTTGALEPTVYGGTLDWSTGILTAIPYAYLPTATPKEAPNKTSAGNTYVAIKTDYTCTDPSKLVCSHYKTVVGVGTDKQIRYNSGTIYIYDSRATENNYKTLFDDVQIAYPTTGENDVMHLTPQQLELLAKYNAVWSDAGPTEIDYVADTKTYIDNALAAIAASVINV